MEGNVMKRVPWTLTARFIVAVIFGVGGATLPVLGQKGEPQQPAPRPSSREVMGVDCARVAELGIEMQTNMRAALVRTGCGIEEPGRVGPAAPGGVPLDDPGPFTNVNTITGPEVLPHVTQSESSVWSSDGNTIVINYNDSVVAPSNYSGLSYSLDGGATFTRILPSPLATGHGTNFGDPILVYNASLATWFAGDLATGCGGQGIGLWTSADGINWNVGSCAHIGNNDDRESMWVDNNPASANYGRMYVSLNNFSISGGAIVVTHSDDGVNWSAPLALNSGVFLRDVQLTGGVDGSVFIAAMNEGSGGGLGLRQNIMFRSMDGGDTWTQITMGAPFAAPGDSVCSNPYFARISPIWRYMGWGQPVVGPGGVVHYVYAGRRSGDAGDIYYTQSSDNGTTWSAPIMLNTDAAAGGTGSQWMPSLSITGSGQVLAHWYDRRNTTDSQNYEIWGRRSPDNGATWLADEVISDVLIPQPEQPDPNVQACYAGDYNYATAFGSTHYATWTDGRNPLSGHFQQDVFFAAVPAAAAASFSVTVDPSSLVIPPGGFGTTTATVTSTGGFSAEVTLACDGQPDGVTCDFSPNPVTPPPDASATSTLTVSVGPDVADGGYDFNVTGTSGGSTQTAAFHLDVVSSLEPTRSVLSRR
jgi:hypothetical protein